jgi:hypothetical protein
MGMLHRMLRGLLERLDGVLCRVNPAGDRGWGPAPTAADWVALFEALPEARGGELEQWFDWHNGQRQGCSLITPDLGAFRRLREQGRLLSIMEALAVREQLLARRDGERFRPALPLFALPLTDDDGSPRYVVYQVSGREAGNLVHTLTLSPTADVWPVAEPRDADGRAGLAVWAASLLALEAEVYGPFDEVELAQRWVLAAPVVRSLWKGDPNRFALGARGGGRSRSAALVLRRDWGIQNIAELRAEVERRFDTVPEPEATAWHWGTIGAAAEFAYQAYLCSAEEAWSIALAAARKLQASFRSWRDYVTAYERQWRALRNDDPDAPALGGEREIVALWLEDERHPWCSVPWDTPLPADLPIPLEAPHTVWNAADADGLHRALLEASSGDVIRLASGHYAGSFVPASSGLTLVGEPGVVLEAISDEPALSTYLGITVQNVELRASGTVVVNRSVFMRLDGCRIIGGDDGLQSHSDAEDGRHDYEIQLVRCTVEGCGDRGVVVEDGFAFLEDTRIVRTGGHALTSRGRAAGFYANRCEILDAGGAAVRAFGSPEVRLDDVVVRSAAGIGVLLADGACGHLSRTTVSDSGGRGVFVKGSSSLFAQQCRVERSGGANLDLADSKDVAVVECEILGGAWGGVYLHPAPGAALVRTQILGAKLACVFADGASSDPPPHLTGCVLGESREGGGIFVANGARLRVMQSAIRDTPAIAVEVAASSLQATRLTIERCAGGVIAHGDAELRLARASVENSEGSAVIVQGARALIDDFRVRGGQRGIVVGQRGHAVVARSAFSELRGMGPDAADGERAFAILAGESSTLVLLGGSIVGDGDDDAVQVMTGARLVADGLNVLAGGNCGIRASSSHLHLVGGSVTGSHSAGILLDGDATASMLRTELEGNACSAVEVRGDATLLIRDAKLAGSAGESAIFAHARGRVLVQGGRFEDMARAISTQDAAVVEQLPLEIAGLSGLLADLVAAVAGPHLVEAREALERWRTDSGPTSPAAPDGLDAPRSPP